MRGEYFLDNPVSFFAWGSPPHARGILAIISSFYNSTGITPACAGNTDWKFHSMTVSRDHPRMRGEYSNIFEAMTVVGGSPPHARGIRCD